ncbi:hypothetical protein D3C76_499710 [compost metagenome]
MGLERDPIVFVLVIGKTGEAGAYLATRDSPEAALEYIRQLGGNDGKDPRVLKKVFSVNQVGSVIYYEVVFNGALKLVQMMPQKVLAPKTPPAITALYDNMGAGDPLGDKY